MHPHNQILTEQIARAPLIFVGAIKQKIKQLLIKRMKSFHGGKDLNDLQSWAGVLLWLCALTSNAHVTLAPCSWACWWWSQRQWCCFQLQSWEGEGNTAGSALRKLNIQFKEMWNSPVMSAGLKAMQVTPWLLIKVQERTWTGSAPFPCTGPGDSSVPTGILLGGEDSQVYTVLAISSLLPFLLVEEKLL